MSDLEARILRLEDESEIRKLKARYLNSCDAKDVDAMRACFTEDAEIEFPPLGSFDLDGLVGIFTQMAATTPITDVHHGHNGEIEISGDQATGRWNLGFATYDPQTKNFRMLSSFYEDRYRKTEHGWRISYTKSTPRAIVDGTLAEDTVTANWLAENE
ncbi:MAG: nuclear transport factor 2 family protein [Acidimicrobiales bacterium]|nr:MAG: nuclear transport factor 2 family protein [Acidimicrobiales bacterium]